MTQENFNSHFFKVWHNVVIRNEIFQHIKKSNNNQYHYKNWVKLLNNKTNEILNQQIEKNNISNEISDSIENLILNPDLMEKINLLDFNLDYITLLKNNKYFFKEKDKDGLNFLHYYCEYKTNSNFKKDFEQFQELGVNFDERDRNGNDIFYYTIKNKIMGLQILDYLLSHGLCTIYYVGNSFYNNCLQKNRPDLIKLFIAHTFDLKSQFTFFIDDSFITEEIKNIFIKLEIFIQKFNKSKHCEKLIDKLLLKRLIIIQILLDDLSTETFNSILDNYGLSSNTNYRYHLIEDSKNLNIFLYGLKLEIDNYKKKFEFNQAQQEK
ncbi:hypothetical protein ACTFIV_010342 [Dictyostelium citrinum]